MHGPANNATQIAKAGSAGHRGAGWSVENRPAIRPLLRAFAARWPTRMGAYRVPSEVPLNSHLPDASRAVLPAYLLPVTGFIAGTKGSDDNPLHDLILRVNAGSASGSACHAKCA